MPSIISNIYVLFILLGLLLLIVVIIYRCIKGTGVQSLWSLLFSSFGTAYGITFLFGAIDFLIDEFHIVDINIDELITAAIIGSVGIALEAINKYLRYYGIRLENKDNKDD